MSFLKKVMANGLGIGGTKVDAVLNNKCIAPGCKLEGVIKIYGGQIEQSIRNVCIEVKTRYEKEVNDKKTFVNVTIQKFIINIDKTFAPNEDFSIPFDFELDANCPITKGNSKVWLSTKLDIENAIDNTDGDSLTVVPNTHMNNILKSIENLGFRIKSVDNIFDKRKISNNGFIQEFEFSPTHGEFRGRLDELELTMIADNNGICAILEVDRKVRGFASFISESLSLDESHVRVYFTYDELNNYNLILNKLGNSIKRFS